MAADIAHDAARMDVFWVGFVLLIALTLRHKTWLSSKEIISLAASSTRRAQWDPSIYISGYWGTKTGGNEA